MARRSRRKTPATGTAPAAPAPVRSSPPGPGRSWRFWMGLVIFQVIFGASVFLLTRAHYERPSAAAPAIAERRGADSVIRPMSPMALASADPLTENLSALSSADLRQRGSARFTAGEYGEAARLYEEVLSREPGNVELRNNFAIALHHSGRSADAVTTLREGLAVDPGHQRSLLTLGFVSRAVGDVPTARDALTRAVAVDATNSIGQEAARFLDLLPKP